MTRLDDGQRHDHHDHHTTTAPSPAGDVVDVAMADPQLSTLVKAIQAAGLVDTLRGAGPFTIFAPNNKRSPASPRPSATR